MSGLHGAIDIFKPCLGYLGKGAAGRGLDYGKGFAIRGVNSLAAEYEVLNVHYTSSLRASLVANYRALPATQARSHKGRQIGINRRRASRIP